MMAKVIAISEKKTMGQTKIMWLLLADILGIPITILGFVFNLDNTKSAILFLVGLGYILTRWYFYAVQKKQAVKQKDMELKSQSIDLWFREQEKLKAQSKTAK